MGKAKVLWWDKRANLTNKPSVSFRTQEVILYLMDEFDLPSGKAIEKLMKEERLYYQIIEKLKEKYPEIDKNL